MKKANNITKENEIKEDNIEDINQEIDNIDDELDAEFEKEAKSEALIQKIKEEELKKFEKYKIKDILNAIEILEQFIQLQERANNILRKLKIDEKETSPQEAFLSKMLSGITK